VILSIGHKEEDEYDDSGDTSKRAKVYSKIFNSVVKNVPEAKNFKAVYNSSKKRGLEDYMWIYDQSKF